MQRKEQKEKEKESKAKQISKLLWNCNSFSKNYLTKENNDKYQMSNWESWLCSFWKLWSFRRLGSL
jgi:hypothetical protein